MTRICIALALLLSGCAETYYQCRQHAGRDICTRETRW